MSFGVAQSAISVIKNNRKLISKRDKLKNTLSSHNENKVEFKGRIISLSELKYIRERIQSENNAIMKKRVIATAFVMIVLLSVFFYYL